MKISKQNLELRRMRPFIGTFVEIEAQGVDSEILIEGIEEGFSSISRVEVLMSRFCSASEVSRFNNLKIGESFKISGDLVTVLVLSEELRELSRGVFDVSLGAGKVFSISEHTLTRIAEGPIDLGGIAKGYAVDQAVNVMEKYGLSGMVNAGGDLKIFGNGSKDVYLQKPSREGPEFYSVKLKDLSVATSTHGGKTVSVFSESCMVADALTKVTLWADSNVANLCLEKYGAKVFSA